MKIAGALAAAVAIVTALVRVPMAATPAPITFADATAAAGINFIHNSGRAAGNSDNDGRADLYITSLEGDRLFHNEGNFKFRDVTKTAGIVNANFGTSAAWFDYDRDGRLDLF